MAKSTQKIPYSGYQVRVIKIYNRLTVGVPSSTTVILGSFFQKGGRSCSSKTLIVISDTVSKYPSWNVIEVPHVKSEYQKIYNTLTSYLLHFFCVCMIQVLAWFQLPLTKLFLKVCNEWMAVFKFYTTGVCFLHNWNLQSLLSELEIHQQLHNPDFLEWQNCPYSSVHHSMLLPACKNPCIASAPER